MKNCSLFILASVFCLVALFEGNPVSALEPVMTTGSLLASERNGATQNSKNVLATIMQSGSTNSREYSVLVRVDGSAIAHIGTADVASTIQEFPAGTIDAGKLRELLSEIGDVSRIPTGHCMKSASFGTTTRIAYAGKASGDLQCLQQSTGGNDVSGELGEFVRATLEQLKINASRR